jgi:hypothetical protein
MLEIGELAIIHKRNEPNLAKGHEGKVEMF